MRVDVKENSSKGTLKDSAVSIPKSIYASKIFGKDVELNNCNCLDAVEESSFSNIFKHQHPLIHMWLFLSSISICVLSALLFIMR